VIFVCQASGQSQQSSRVSRREFAQGSHELIDVLVWKILDQLD